MKGKCSEYSEEAFSAGLVPRILQYLVTKSLWSLPYRWADFVFFHSFCTRCTLIHYSWSQSTRRIKHETTCRTFFQSPFCWYVSVVKSLLIVSWPRPADKPSRSSRVREEYVFLITCLFTGHVCCLLSSRIVLGSASMSPTGHSRATTYKFKVQPQQSKITWDSNSYEVHWQILLSSFTLD